MNSYTTTTLKAHQHLTLQEAAAMLQPLLHQPVQQVRLGHGSFVTLEFGAVQSYYPRTGNPKYEWMVWLYQCNWRLEQHGTFITGCADERTQMGQVELLKGKSLQSLSLSPLLDLLLEFKGGYQLRIFRHAGGDTDHWLIYTPGAFVLTARGDRLLYEASTPSSG